MVPLSPSQEVIDTLDIEEIHCNLGSPMFWSIVKFFKRRRAYYFMFVGCNIGVRKSKMSALKSGYLGISYFTCYIECKNNRFVR